MQATVCSFVVSALIIKPWTWQNAPICRPLCLTHVLDDCEEVWIMQINKVYVVDKFCIFSCLFWLWVRAGHKWRLSIFCCILYIQKGIHDFFPEILWFSLVDFHFKKIWQRGGPTNMDFLYAKEAHWKNLNSAKN